jgi:hypothetical protein
MGPFLFPLPIDSDDILCVDGDAGTTAGQVTGGTTALERGATAGRASVGSIAAAPRSLFLGKRRVISARLKAAP